MVRIRLCCAYVLLILSLIACGSSAADVPSRVSATEAQSEGNANIRVWVNTKSGVYHCPGTRWYGNTKQGEFMTQKQARSKGYRPAYGAVCG